MLRPLVAAACAVVLLAAGAGLGFLLDRGPSPSAQLALRPVGDLDPAASGKVSLLGDGVNVRVSHRLGFIVQDRCKQGFAVPRRFKRGLIMLIAIPLVVYAIYAGTMYERQLQILFPGTTEHHP